MNQSKLPPFLPFVETLNICVDNFKKDYGDVYFLTHFHADHYVGLKKKFRGNLYASKITAQLVKDRYDIPAYLITIITPEIQFFIGEQNDVKVTPICANHCPGAVMLLFQTRAGHNVLHTGDFRANDYIINYNFPSLNALFLDNTYLRSRMEFPPQQLLEQQVGDLVDTYANNKMGIMKFFTSTRKTLFVFGNYTIGKEQLALECARRAQTTLYAPDFSKRRVLDVCFGDTEWKSYLSADPYTSAVHLMSIRKINMEHLTEYLHDLKCNGGEYTHLVAFKCTGWTMGKKQIWNVTTLKPVRINGTISIYNIPYSEHSSVSELQSFVEKLNVDKIYNICG